MLLFEDCKLNIIHDLSKKVHSFRLQLFSCNHSLESSILEILFLFLGISLLHFFQLKNTPELNITHWTAQESAEPKEDFSLYFLNGNYSPWFSQTQCWLKCKYIVICKSKCTVIYFALCIGKLPRVPLNNIIVVCLLTQNLHYVPVEEKYMAMAVHHYHQYHIASI